MERDGSRETIPCLPGAVGIPFQLVSPGWRGDFGGIILPSLLVVPGTRQGKETLPSRSPFPTQSGLKSGAPFCPGTKAPGHFNSTEGLADSSDCQSPVAARLPPTPINDAN